MLDRHFELAELEPTTRSTYVGYAAKHIRPLTGREQVGALDADLFDSLYAELRRCRDHCDRKPRTDHRTEREHVCDERCRPHICRPLGDSTIRQIHFILSGALRRAVRWRWIGTSPIGQAEPPPAPKPDPRPPSATDAAHVVHAAWSDPEWVLVLWLIMVTGIRRGELCALRWMHVDLVAGVLSVRSGPRDRRDARRAPDSMGRTRIQVGVRPGGRRVRVLHCTGWWQAPPAGLREPALRRPRAPSRHPHVDPQAEALLRDGADLRRRRPAHRGRTARARRRGTTTLRYYTAWVSESDQRAASTLSARMPARPGADDLPPPRLLVLAFGRPAARRRAERRAVIG